MRPDLDLDVRDIDVDLSSRPPVRGPRSRRAYLRHGTHILAQQPGGEQERHRRAGTENVAGAVGLAAAYALLPTSGPRP